jgi:N-acetyl-alpha-D-glucosaminyl L-malate synthase BshA
LFAEPGQKIITHISNFRPVKRVQDVIESFALIREEIDAVLVLVGEGPEKNRIELLARQLGVDKYVRYLGKIKDVEQVLCLSDLFLLTSESESFGLAALEAMAAGVPVMSTNTGGLPEVNTHNETGFLNDVGDTKTMSENAIKTLRDEALYEKLSSGAKRRSKDFEIDKIISQYEKIYTSLLTE